jgi:hypothetical protein
MAQHRVAEPLQIFVHRTELRRLLGLLVLALCMLYPDGTLSPHSPCYFAPPYTTQVLWLFGADHQVTEVGAMNIFFVLKKKDGSGTEVRNAGLCAVWDARA